MPAPRHLEQVVVVEKAKPPAPPLDAHLTGAPAVGAGLGGGARGAAGAAALVTLLRTV